MLAIPSIVSGPGNRQDARPNGRRLTRRRLKHRAARRRHSRAAGHDVIKQSEYTKTPRLERPTAKRQAHIRPPFADRHGQLRRSMSLGQQAQDGHSRSARGRPAEHQGVVQVAFHSTPKRRCNGHDSRLIGLDAGFVQRGAKPLPEHRAEPLAQPDPALKLELMDHQPKFVVVRAKPDASAPRESPGGAPAATLGRRHFGLVDDSSAARASGRPAGGLLPQLLDSLCERLADRREDGVAHRRISCCATVPA